jgi:hypothetical protein
MGLEVRDVAGDKYALLVGAKGYTKVPPLKWADKDACDVAQALESCGFDRQNMTVLHDGDEAEPPVRAQLFHHLGRLKGRLKPEDLLVFYFSGHGMIQDDDDYLLPVDASEQSLTYTGAKVGDVVSELRRSGSKQVLLLLDACRNELPTGKGIRSLGDISAKSIRDDTDGVAAIFSCEGRERSYEIDHDDEGIHQSAFTYCLLQAIERPTVNTVKEVADYLRQEVKVLNGKYNQQPQTPFLVARPDELLDLRVFVAAAMDAMPEEFEQFIAYLTQLYGADQIDQNIYYDVMAFLHGDAHDPGRVKLVSDVCGGVSNVAMFERIWKHYRTDLTPRKPPPGAFGDLGSPARPAES